MGFAAKPTVAREDLQYNGRTVREGCHCGGVWLQCGGEKLHQGRRRFGGENMWTRRFTGDKDSGGVGPHMACVNRSKHWTQHGYQSGEGKHFLFLKRANMEVGMLAKKM